MNIKKEVTQHNFKWKKILKGISGVIYHPVLVVPFVFVVLPLTFISTLTTASLNSTIKEFQEADKVMCGNSIYNKDEIEIFIKGTKCKKELYISTKDGNFKAENCGVKAK